MFKQAALATYQTARWIKNDLPQLWKHEQKVSLKPKSKPKGRVLLAFEPEFYKLSKTDQRFRAHTRYWEFVQVANIFLELGYAVDVIHWQNKWFVPSKKYDFFFDTRFTMERIAPLLGPDCVKVYYGQTAHIHFHNAAEHRRLLELKDRRGAVLMTYRAEMPNRALEHADCATVLGNGFTLGTYRYANKPLYPIRNSVAQTYPWPENKDFDACRHNFLWFASDGMVHKGLDLMLEAFAAMPEYQLTICGPVEKEREFAKAYHQELYQTPNIHLVGWTDVSSPKFVEIANRCAALVYPSCSEGQAGAVITCMHAGLIPIMSYESGVDAQDFGTILKTCSIEEIQTEVRRIAALPGAELERRSRRAWEFAQANHTRERFTTDYRAFIVALVEGRLETELDHQAAIAKPRGSLAPKAMAASKL